MIGIILNNTFGIIQSRKFQDKYWKQFKYPNTDYPNAYSFVEDFVQRVLSSDHVQWNMTLRLN